ncbi:DUF423 domain-containing protein [Lysobacter alkalisoli]|uniref:DUF423 domain-containing protein n=2 Tax=Marilutibacter alkalisoli TaxID=2591633 RepID=A0A514BWF5_9GAMM|nr:DUF423 domain-containing protein [Lysobacter alkalisoli]QDH71744.1 DUF423 domain-containing protein [Lysobacter alkalisoli]
MQRALGSAGAVLSAAAVALAAYASHAADPEARGQLLLAAVFAFGHGVALAALAPGAGHRLRRLALVGLLLGVLLFSGSLVAAHGFGLPTRLAPYGGILMILAWLVHAIDAAFARPDGA